MTDSTNRPPPKKTAIFLKKNNVSSYLLDTRKDATKTTSYMYLLVCKGPSSGEVGVARGAVSQKIRPRVGLQTGDFVQRKVGGGVPEDDSDDSPQE